MIFRFLPDNPDICDISPDDRFEHNGHGLMEGEVLAILVVKITESLYISRSLADGRQGRFLRVVDDKLDSYKI